MNESKSFLEPITSFDYEALEREQGQTIQQLTQEIRDCLRRSAQDIWEIGQKLADVRDRLKYGQFDTWLKVEFGWSRRTAYNFISVYQTFGERANLAQVDIATSALYLLAAPSTPQKVREEFLQKAQAGQTITHKQLSEVIQKEKSQSKAESSPDNKEEKAVSIKPEIVNIIPKANPPVVSTSESETVSSESQASSSTVKTIETIQGGWHRLGEQHFLFCGDTASSAFATRIPYASLAIAITAEDWDHDWLVEKAKSVMIFPESDYKPGLIEQLITLFTQPGETVIFPWLPNPDMITIAHQLNRKIFAGDPNRQRCQLAIEQSNHF
ncbi:unknown [Crocosphaera subtropica ATCC 51142]|uniref:DUF3102 domain-containing protein n=1 Tax=Crocosphaera subtropica (strain ATCC 51142 / BH68) TaxID=43989 RepID=B1WWU8_CROS5|nr:DUF3102 domain-containing protein [Crocosphaera subtropica]ACB52417.1 unknown [Crocosphaera subtropica ATCC 51142]